MTARAESASSGLDTAKLVLAILVLVGGIAGFYYYAEKVGLLYRVLGMLATVGTASALILTTQIGKSLLMFLRDARVEVRKIVWPSRQETMQSTMVVVALVFIMGLLLWTLDAGLFWGVSLLTGQGK